MRRIRTIKLDNLEFKVAPMSYDETEEYLRENLAMVERKATEDEKAARTLDTVVKALNLAANGNEADKWDRAKLTKELDTVTIIELHSKYLEMCSLRILKPGEVPAAPTSTSN